MLIYPDACVLIYLIEEHAEMYPSIDKKLRAPGNLTLALSDLIRLECRIRPMRQLDWSLLARFDRFFSNPGHIYIPASRPVFNLATELRAMHNLKTPDALHLAAALHGGCDQFWTNDHRFEKAADGRIDIVTFS